MYVEEYVCRMQRIVVISRLCSRHVMIGTAWAQTQIAETPTYLGFGGGRRSVRFPRHRRKAFRFDRPSVSEVQLCLCGNRLTSLQQGYFVPQTQLERQKPSPRKCKYPSDGLIGDDRL